MSMTLPVFRRLDPSATAPLDYEIAQEKAAALGRLGRGLERALAALATFDAARRNGENAGDVPESPGGARASLVEAAGHALWLFLVQREACGLRDARTVMRDYGVPAEVQNSAGAFPVQSAPRRGR